MRAHALAALAAALLPCASGEGLVDPAIISGLPPLYLDGNAWTTTATSTGQEIGATVPGDLITDIQRAGLMGDALYALNWIDHALLWDNDTWTYARTFDVEGSGAFSLGQAAEVLLVFDSVKLAADITLNGQPVAVGPDAPRNQFRRFTYPVKALLQDRNNTLRVSFLPTQEDTRNTDGRWMGCSGGWDWSSYSAPTGTSLEGVRTQSKGIVKSVYLVAIPAGGAAITHLLPLPSYQGGYPTAPLTPATQGPFAVTVRAFFWAPAAVTGTVNVTGAWSPAAAASTPVSLAAGDSSATLVLPANPSDYSLWWPNGMGAQPLYSVAASFVPSLPAPFPAVAPTVSRRVGFRTVALVTDDDTDPSTLEPLDGSGNLTLRLKVNGADFFARGANWIPMEQLEGRLSSSAHLQAVRAAADVGMNLFRVWGGGVPPFEGWLDACDEAGILISEDAMYSDQADSYHMARVTADQDDELRHTTRRLASHASLAYYNGCNECGGAGAFESFVVTTIAEEDPTHPVWPSCPSSGWASGVDRLWGLPNGSPAGLKVISSSGNSSAGAAASGLVPCSSLPEWEGVRSGDGDASCLAQPNGRYHGFPVSLFNVPTPVSGPQDCCNLCANTTACVVAIYASNGCQLKGSAGGDPVPTYQSGVTALWPAGKWPVDAIPVVPTPNSAEAHGPYQGGSGIPSVNGGQWSTAGFDADLPSELKAPSPMGTTSPGFFTSEFGSSSLSSFESMAPTLSPDQWGISGDPAVQDSCGEGFSHRCTGTNQLAQRNYPCHNFWTTYFKNLTLPSGLSVNSTGEAAFRGQLYLCQLASAIELKSSIEWHRSTNLWGLATWQLNEIWPTGGWGTIEYGTVGFTGGQVIGGRWKPAHYNFITGYADVFGACGKAGACYLKNDGALAAVSANVALNVLHIATGSVSVLLAAAPVALPRGANAMHWYCASGAGSVPPACPSWSSALPAAGCAPDGSDCVLQVLATDATTGAVLSSNWQLLALPSSLALPRAKLTWTVAPSPNADRSVNVTVSAAPASPAQDVGSALFVTLTTLAQGRFSDNNFHLPSAATRTLAFLPFLPGQESVLAESLRVEHLAQYVLGA